jgi:hypothetical protein
MKTQDRLNGLYEFVLETLGYPGRMIAGSKSYYRQLKPDNVAIFNANLCTSDKKIWYGDIDVTLDVEKLSLIAQKAGETIYILHEMDCRFDTEYNVNINKAVAIFYSDGRYHLSKDYALYYTKFVPKD